MQGVAVGHNYHLGCFVVGGGVGNFGESNLHAEEATSCKMVNYSWAVAVPTLDDYGPNFA